jgi:WD40 repeat protein
MILRQPDIHVFYTVIRVWNAKTGAFLWDSPELKEHMSPVIRFTPDSKHVLAVNWWGSITEWEAATGKKVRERKVPEFNTGRQLADVSADGSRFVWVNPQQLNDYSGPVSVVVTDGEGRELRRIRQPASVRALRLSGNGRRVAIAGGGGSLRVFDTVTGLLVRTLQDGASQVLHVAFRADGKVIRSTHEDATIREYNSANGKLIRLTQLELPPGEHLITISPDGRLWATATAEGRCRVWDFARGRPRMQVPETVFVPRKQRDPWRDWKPGMEEPEPDPKSVMLTFACGDRYLLGLTGEGNTIAVWDVLVGKSIATVLTPDEPVSLALSDDGRTLFAGGDSSIRGMNKQVPKALRVWDLPTGKQVWETEFTDWGKSPDSEWAGNAMRSLHVVDGGEAIAAVETYYFYWHMHHRAGRHETYRARLISRKEGVAEQVLDIHYPDAIAVSPDGRWLVSGSTRLWNLATGEAYGDLYSRYRFLAGDTVSGTFHPDGKRFAFGQAEGSGILQCDVESVQKYVRECIERDRKSGIPPVVEKE